MVVFRFILFLLIAAIVIYIIWSVARKYAQVTAERAQREDMKFHKSYKKMMESDVKKTKTGTKKANPTNRAKKNK